MKVFTFSTSDGGLSPSLRAIARIRTPATATEKGVAREDWHPVIFHAETEEAAYAAARAWWDEQIAKERQKVANAAAAGERMRARKAAPVTA